MIKNYREFKDLNPIIIFEYYDFPMFYVAESSKSELYMHHYVNEVKNGVDKWLVARITKKEYRKLVNQQTGVLEFLNKLRTNERLYHLCFDIHEENLEKELIAELITKENFKPKSFPSENYFVDYDYLEDQPIEKITEKVTNLKSFKLVLKDRTNKHDIELSYFNNVMGKFQSSLDSLATHNISKLIDQKNEQSIHLNLLALEASSFGVTMMIDPNNIDIFNTSEEAVLDFMHLIDDVSNGTTQDINDQIYIDESYSVETVKHVKTFLKTISDKKYSFIVEAKDEQNEVFKNVSFREDAYQNIEILDKILEEQSSEMTETFTISGNLTMVSMQRNRFRIEDVKSDDKEIIVEPTITGKISKEVIKRINDNNLKFYVPSKISATIERRTITDYVKDEHSNKNTLIKYEQPEESSQDIPMLKQ
ncbi:hypothetical protein [Exiguobacterium sp. s80]|uniref:hypothetical protein n=1 Tax=Exiguobacterium sp. s80 TaxID=2751209 RepID=UPI001BEB6BFD|nr:hypothetical protein [Exiguobacterium sp. s80]